MCMLKKNLANESLLIRQCTTGSRAWPAPSPCNDVQYILFNYGILGFSSFEPMTNFYAALHLGHAFPTMPNSKDQ